MSLKNGILGFVWMKPLSGYDIKKLNISASYFWSTDQAKIYRSLRNLEKKEIDRSERVCLNEGPSKMLYRITDKGRETLRGWLLSPNKRISQSGSFSDALFFSGALGKKRTAGAHRSTQIEQNNILLQKLRDNYNKNKSNYIRD